MPAITLGSFEGYRLQHFHIGGSVDALLGSARRWSTFADHAADTASMLRGIDDGGFVGTEGDRYRELLNADFPQQLQTTADAHAGLARSLETYAGQLQARLIEMAGIRFTALTNHTAVNTTAQEVYAAEAAVVAAPDAASKAAAITALGIAQAAHDAAVAAWEGSVSAGENLKASFGDQVSQRVADIAAQAREAFEDNPNIFESAWNAIKDFVHEHADILKIISDALQLIGGILMFIPGLHGLGILLTAVGVGLKGLLALCGEVSWAEFAFDLLTSGAVGGLAGLARAGKLGNLGSRAIKGVDGAMDGVRASASAVKNAMKAGADNVAMKLADGASHAFGEAGQQIANKAYKKITRGSEICFAAEPVDMATGNMVDFVEDIRISGTLPLVVDRNANTAHQLGRALGPRWVSTMDTHIEVLADEVLMVAPDGALLTFPPAPEDGSEVRGDGRGWLLSYGDGTYRVRNITAGLTYEFAVYDTTDELDDPTSPQREDTSPALNRSHIGIGIPPNSVADRFDVGIEIGLSAQIHHTGHRIDYFWDNATGHMTSMVRSDDTRLDITWDDAANRVASIWVSNQTTHPENDPQRLISYQYDTTGQLIRVINSHAGVLRYHYDNQGRPCGWTDRNGASYYYRFDDHGRVTAQVGTGGMFPNILYWGDDTGDDAPLGGQVCVLIETAAPFPDDPLTIGDDIIDDYLNRLYQLPLYQALVDGGLEAAGLTGRGRTGQRDDTTWSVPDAWLHDEVLGDIRPTVYRSTLSGDVWRIITPEGGVEDREYNDYHQIVTRTTSAGATTRTDYNDDGLVVATVYPDGTTTYVEPGSWGVPVRVVGRDGHATEYDVDVFGMTTAITDPTGARSSFDYQIRASGAVVAASTSPEGLTTTIECDDAGRQLAVTDPAGRRTSLKRDVRGLVTASMDPDGHTTTIDYTPEGWPTRVTHPDGSSVSATYDGEGNLLSSTNESGATTTTEYTVFDKPVATTDATGAVTRLAYNTQMQPVALTNADGHTWSYEYDLDGMITRETDYNGIVTESSLSPDGLISQVTTPAGMTTITRNLLGLTETIVDASGTTTYTYDDLGRVTTITNPETTISYTRDEYGRITAEAVTLSSGESTISAMDFTATGLVAEQHLGLPSADTVSTSFVRNSVGEVSSSQITHRVHRSEVPVTVADLTYSRGSRGQRDKITTGALVRTFAYGTRGRITTDHTTRLTTNTETITGTGAGLEEIAGRDFTWRADSVLTGIVDQLRGTTSFDVDPLGRVTSVTRDRSSTTAPRPASASYPHDSYKKDGTGPSSSAGQGSVVTESYGFSAAGVLSSIATPTLSTSSGAVAPAATSVARVQTAATATADAQVDFQGTMPTRVGRTTYTYDKAGRVTQTVTRRISKKPLVKHFYYAASGQPIGFDTSDEPGVGYRYVYDGLDRRVAKEQIDTATGRVLARMMFAHRGNQLVAQQATVGPERGAGFVWTHDPASGEIIGQITLTGTHTHHPTTITNTDATPADVRDWDQDRVDAEFFALVADLAGAPHEIIDPATGDVVGSSSQTLYGKRTWHGEQSSPLLFAGQYYDDESGWAYNRFRYYHPDAGVYNAQDPLGAAPRIASAQGYVNHPAYWVDVLGLMAHTLRGPDGKFAKGNKGSASYTGNSVEMVKNQLRADNYTILADEVSIVGNGTRARADTLAMNPQGEIVGIEVKLNSGRYTENQATVYSHIAEGNSANIVGEKIKPVSEVTGRANPVVTKIESFRVVEPAVGEGRAQIIKNDLPKPKSR